MIVDKQLISKILFKDVFNDKPSNTELLKNIIISNLSDSATEFILHAVANPDFEILNKNDYFKVKSDISGVVRVHNQTLDILSDMGLYEDGYVYGQVLDSDDYGSEFITYHHSMKVQLFLCDSLKKVDKIKMESIMSTIRTWELIKINKLDIKYFNYGADKPSTS